MSNLTMRLLASDEGVAGAIRDIEGRMKMEADHHGSQAKLSSAPGRIEACEAMISKHPTRAMTMAVTGMLPHNRLGRSLATNLRVYAGADHPHQAQNPTEHTF